jgi:hypothetical protein
MDFFMPTLSKPTLIIGDEDAPNTIGQLNKNAELKNEADKLARLLYRIYKEDYPKIKHRMKQKL